VDDDDTMTKIMCDKSHVTYVSWCVRAWWSTTDLSCCREWSRCRCLSTPPKFCSGNTAPCLLWLLQTYTLVRKIRYNITE